MALDTLEIFGDEWTGVAGFKATDDNGNIKTYIRPQGTISISSNGNGIDVSQYASANVLVSPALQTITKTYTPTTSQQTDTITPGVGYYGIDEVDVTVDAVPIGLMYADATYGFYTDSGVRKWYFQPAAVIESGDSYGQEGYIFDHTIEYGTTFAFRAVPSGTTITPTTSAQTVGGNQWMMEGAITVSAMPTASWGASQDSVTKDGGNYIYSVAYPNFSPGYVSEVEPFYITIALESKSVTPSETAQTVTPTNDYYYLESVTVSAIPSTYVGSGVTQRTSSDLSAIGATVTAPAGYYASSATYTIGSGSATTPATTITANPTISIDANGLITATVSGSQSITPTVSAGYVSSGTAGTVSVSGSDTYQLTKRDSSDLSASGDTVTAPAGYYPSAATMSVASGTAGTPTATKGAVNNHSISVTPSVTNTAGYISGGTINGTAVSVSASELVSGNLPITSNGSDIDVTNYATVSVSVPSKNVQVAAGVDRVASTAYTAVNGQTLTVAKTGTYHVYWSGYRSSTSGTNGSQLYIGNTAYGTANTTFTNNGQYVHLTNVSLTANQTITVRARSRSTSYYMYVSNLTIVEA